MSDASIPESPTRARHRVLQAQAAGLALALGAGLSGACLSACGETESSDPAADLCANATGYVSQCDAATPCDEAFRRDCAAITPLLSEQVVAIMNECLNNLGPLIPCFGEAAVLAMPTRAQQEAATSLCLECGSGAGECEATVLAAGDDPLGRAGRVIKSLAEPQLQAVVSECVAAGDQCVPGFIDCSLAVLQRSAPTESLVCVLQGVLGEGPSCGGDGDGDGDGDGGPNCQWDSYEPNQSEGMAFDFGDIGDADSQGMTIAGELDESADDDWFSYRGVDNFGNVVTPYAEVDTPDLRVCMFFECDNGLANTSVTCPMGAVQTPSLSGRPGCCADEVLDVDIDCLGTITDTAQVYMRVDNGPDDACTGYQLSFHY